MKVYIADSLNQQEKNILCQRQALSTIDVTDKAREIIGKVKEKGDVALKEFSEKFDKVKLEKLQVTEQEIASSSDKVSIEIKNAFKIASANITKFHKSQVMARKTVETTPGVKCFYESRAIEKVGLYIPGGSAPLSSTLLMLAIPAKLAGCKDIILCTPPKPDGSVDESILYAANMCGVKKIFKVGGAQAIAAMAYGTETIPKVFKIFGPGNQYVTAAKILVSSDASGAAMDMPAGPTELLIIADKSARADFAAADLLSQAEHGEDSQVLLVCPDSKKTQEIVAETEKQLKNLPRKAIAKKALENSFALIVGSVDEAISFSNIYAPEHLILNVENYEELTDKITDAGSVFLGPYSSESAGDYASGTNHCLPTYGYARAYSGVSIASFQKQITFQEVSKLGANSIAPAVITMANAESLKGHANAMEVRT